MTQPLDLNELASKTVDAVTSAMIRYESFLPPILSALTKLAAVKDADFTKVMDRESALLNERVKLKAALKIATDALNEYQKPEHWILESAEWRWIPDPHVSFANPQDVAEDALQQIEEMKP